MSLLCLNVILISFCSEAFTFVLIIEAKNDESEDLTLFCNQKFDAVKCVCLYILIYYFIKPEFISIHIKHLLHRLYDDLFFPLMSVCTMKTIHTLEFDIVEAPPTNFSIQIHHVRLPHERSLCAYRPGEVMDRCSGARVRVPDKNNHSQLPSPRKTTNTSTRLPETTTVNSKQCRRFTDSSLNESTRHRHTHTA